MKTNELTGAALDWAVCLALGRTDMRIDPDDGEMLAQDDFDYSTDWSQGGPIIEREMIQLTPHCMINPLYGWSAAYRSFDEDDDIYALHRMRGRTPLIAAMRCYVASKLGDEIDLPKELI